MCCREEEIFRSLWNIDGCKSVSIHHGRLITRFSIFMYKLKKKEERSSSSYFPCKMKEEQIHTSRKLQTILLCVNRILETEIKERDNKINVNGYFSTEI